MKRSPTSLPTSLASTSRTSYSAAITITAACNCRRGANSSAHAVAGKTRYERLEQKPRGPFVVDLRLLHTWRTTNQFPEHTYAVGAASRRRVGCFDLLLGP